MVQRIRASLLRGVPGDMTPRVLVACSGGRDSVVLAHLLQPLVRSGAISASIAHVDHAVRADSEEAAQVVEEYARALGWAVCITRLGSDVLSRHPGVGVEEALRRERYLALAEMAAETGADAVALGHHQRDQAETVLLHLIRGAGLHGAAGMREWSTVDVPWWGHRTKSQSLKLWRPMLSESVDHIADWHREHGLPLAEDQTNQDREMRRNAIRHDVLPELERIVPGATANLARFADFAAEDDDLLDRIAGEHVLVQPGGGIHRSAIIEAPRAIQRRVVRHWIGRVAPDVDLTSDRTDAVCRMAERNRTGSQVEIGGGWAVQINQGVLSLRRP